MCLRSVLGTQACRKDGRGGGLKGRENATSGLMPWKWCAVRTHRWRCVLRSVLGTQACRKDGRGEGVDCPKGWPRLISSTAGLLRSVLGTQACRKDAPLAVCP